MILEITQGEKSFGANNVFSELNFLVKEQEKIALIGRNGSGKTTLLRIIEGSEKLDTGRLIKSNKIDIGYLSQTVVVDAHSTVKDYLKLAFNDLLEIENKLIEMEEMLATDYQAVNMQEYAKLQSYFEQHEGYNIDYLIASVFTRFGFSEADLSKKVTDFSEGQKTKISFVKLLLRKPDLLLLDEPTNHLDLETIEWLEDYLKNYPKTLIIVSHDRFFLDCICNVTYEMELGKTTRYGGNYTFFQQEKKAAMIQEEKIFRNQKEEIERLETIIEKFRYKKSKAAFAQSKIKYLQRMDKVELTKTNEKTFKADFGIKTKGGKTVCVLNEYEIGYKKPLAKINLDIMRNQRIGVIGPNGCGKSTLLKSIANKIPSLGGESNFGHQISLGYFDQQLSVIDRNNNVIEELWESQPNLTRTEIRSILGQFLFSNDDVFKKIDNLSGGEKVRLAFAKLMMEENNFLVLDEPTNHLDILSKEALEEALLKYDGTIMFVSHDRYFLARLADSLLVFSKGNFQYFPYGYQEYQDRNKDVKKSVAANKEKKIEVTTVNPEKTLKKLEKQITKVENTLKSLEDLGFEQEYYSDFLKMQQLQERIDEEDDKLKSLLKKWEQLQ